MLKERTNPRVASGIKNGEFVSPLFVFSIPILLFFTFFSILNIVSFYVAGSTLYLSLASGSSLKLVFIFSAVTDRSSLVNVSWPENVEVPVRSTALSI